MDERIKIFDTQFGRIQKPVYSPSYTIFGIRMQGICTVRFENFTIRKTDDGFYSVDNNKFEPDDFETPDDASWFLSDGSDDDKDYTACDKDSCDYCGDCIY